MRRLRIAASCAAIFVCSCASSGEEASTEAMERRRAAAWVEMKFGTISVFTQSGGRGWVADMAAFSADLAYPPKPDELGSAVRKALAASRPFGDDFNFDDAMRLYNNWQQEKILATGSKSEEDYNAGLKACGLFEEIGFVRLTPSMDGKGGLAAPHAPKAELRYFDIAAPDSAIQAAVLECLAISY